MWPASNRGYGKKLGSPTLKAVAVDSIADVFVTLVVILAMVLSKFTSFNVDAWGGFAVGLFVLYMGGQSLRETASPLIGQKPETEFVERVRDIVLERPCVRGVHDIVVHDYGHGVRYVTLDVEVPGDLSVTDIHDEIDFAEHQLRKQLGCKAAIHMDPVMEDTERLHGVRETLADLMSSRFPEFELQDIRIVEQEPKDKLVFEVDVPMEQIDQEEALRKELKALAENALPEYSIRVILDHTYV